MITVKEVMTANPTSATPEDSMRMVREVMKQGGFRRMPVVQNGRLVGIVSDRDLRRATNSPLVLRERWYDDMVLDQVTVVAVMTAKPITVAANVPLAEAVQLIVTHKIGGLPVVDDEARLVGIITETDLMRYLLKLLKN